MLHYQWSKQVAAHVVLDKAPQCLTELWTLKAAAVTSKFVLIHCFFVLLLLFFPLGCSSTDQLMFQLAENNSGWSFSSQIGRIFRLDFSVIKLPFTENTGRLSKTLLTSTADSAAGSQEKKHLTSVDRCFVFVTVQRALYHYGHNNHNNYITRHWAIIFGSWNEWMIFTWKTIKIVDQLWKKKHFTTLHLVFN